MLRSLKFRFLSVLLFMLLMIGGLAIIQYNYTQKINHLYESQQALKELQLKHLEMELARASFFLTNDSKFLNDVEVYANTMDAYFSIVDDYLQEFTYPESLEKNIELYLDTFMRISKLHESKKRKRLMIALGGYAQEINAYIKKEKERLMPIITRKIDGIVLLQNIIYIVMALLSAFMIFIVFKPIINSIFVLKEFFASYKDSSERFDVEQLYFNEVKDIALFVNKMLETQENIQKELLLSRDEALRLQNVKDEFLSNMSHELRTPLNSICGFSEMLLRKLPQEEEIINPIVKSAQHLLQLVSDILDLSKIQSGKFEIIEEPFKLSDEIATFQENFLPLMQSKNIEFSLEFDADKELYLKGDWFRISQILNNFISNAIKFTPDDGKITLVIKYASGEFYAGVQDSGIGIEEGAIEKITNPFEQSDGSVTKKFGGTGLGLSIAKTLTEMMQGVFKIESKLGEGSTFSISLPLEALEMQESQKEQELDAKEEETSIEAHILIAEDNKTNQLLLGMLLDDLGITYDIANDGQEAVDIFQENRYDMILMDENMPHLSGVDAMLAIRDKFTKVPPIIAVTANAMKGDRERLVKLGMDGFLSKPIDNDLLIKTIQKNLVK